jgi:peptidoglycan/LPS O-acetylase OafA/YrhL
LFCSNTAFGLSMDKQTRRVPTLDGWRALAVTGVMLLHGRFFSNRLLERLSIHGGSGVAVFFAISGFLICHLLLEEHDRTGSIDLASFYFKRCVRIMPAYCMALVGVTLIAALGAIQLDSSQVMSCLLFYRNYLPLGMDEASGYYTAHFWSLSVEVHFYLIWPLIVAFLAKRAGKVAFALAIAVFIWRLFQPHVMGDTRMDGLFWGCLVAIYLNPLRRWVADIRFNQLWLPIGAIVVVAMRLPVAPVWTVCLEAVLLPALVLSTVLQPESWLSRALEWQPLAWMGSISYSLYLWQQFFLPPWIPARGPFHLLQREPWNVAAIFVMATLSFYLVERPMIRWGHRVTCAPRLIKPRRTHGLFLPHGRFHL